MARRRCSIAPSATISPISSAGVGSIIFGAAIALVGQMYHLGDDFAGGLLLWASGALAAAVLTGSHSALAVALAAGCVWSGMRVDEMADVHPQFAIFWLIAAALALTWQTTAARHLVAVAALVGAFLGGRRRDAGPDRQPEFHASSRWCRS